MLKVSLGLIAVLTVACAVDSEAQSTRALTAPTLYIAASGEYNKYSTTLDVKGASNLPPGSRLIVELADFAGYKSSILSEDRSVVLNEGGLFEIILRPLPGKRFKDNMVCYITFIPHDIPRDSSVLKVVGENGELLGIENNPQVHKNSGGYYPQAIVHIP
jgi:hypothetical protein